MSQFMSKPSRPSKCLDCSAAEPAAFHLRPQNKYFRPQDTGKSHHSSSMMLFGGNTVQHVNVDRGWKNTQLNMFETSPFHIYFPKKKFFKKSDFLFSVYRGPKF